MKRPVRAFILLLAVATFAGTPTRSLVTKAAADDAEEMLDAPEGSSAAELGDDDVDDTAEDKVAKLEEQAKTVDGKIEVTKREIGRIRDATYLPDLYFTLADLHVEKSRILYLLKNAKNPDKKPDQMDFTSEKRPKQEAADIYQKIYSFFPKYEHRDKALFLKGLELRDLGVFDQMIRTFVQLSQEFPNSEHFNEANIIIGDFLFEAKKELDGAAEAYSRVVGRPLSAFTPVAHYRLGWVQFNQTKYADAVQSFETAIEKQSLINPTDLPELYRKTDIRREAVTALAVPYVEVYSDPEKKRTDLVEPEAYFRGKSPDHFTFRKVLTRAGRRLILKEKWREAADCFYHALALNTDFDARFEDLQRINEIHRRRQSRVPLLPLVKEIALTVDLLQATQPQPIRITADLIAKLKAARAPASKPNEPRKPIKIAGVTRAMSQLAYLELLMRDLATQMQAKARAEGSPQDHADAAEAYNIYLSRFASAPPAAEMRLNRAESLFRAESWVRAGIEYEQLSRLRGNEKKRSEYQESAIETYTKAMQIADKLSLVEKIRARQGLRVVGGIWLKANPRKPGSATVAFNIANSWYEERQLKQAIGYLKKFIASYPADSHVRDAIFLIINSYSQLDDYKGLQAAGNQLVSTAGLSGEDKQTIRDAVKRAQSKQLQTVAGDFGTKEYAENLISVANKYKGSALGQQALYEAFQSLKSKKDPELFDVGEAMLDQQADSQYAKEVSSTMATLSLNAAAYDRAAKYLSRFAEKYPQEPESKQFRETSAVLFERQGDLKKARAVYAQIGNKVAVARIDLALTDWPRLEQSSVEAAIPESEYWHALAVWRQGKYQEATKLLKALASSTTAPVDQSGHARFLLSQLVVDRFRGVQMKSSEDQAALAEKIKLFDALSKELQGLVATGAGKWSIAALYLLGQTHYDLGQFVANSPLPPGLSDADKATYIGELQKQASTYLVEANKVFAKCAEAAEKNDVFTRYVDGCRAKGQKLVKEDQESAARVPASAVNEPPRARAIRRKLFEQADDVPMLFDLADTYVRADQPRTAAGIYSRILELDSTNARAIASIGVTQMKLGEPDAAYASYKKALEIDSKEPTALGNLAELYKSFGFNSKLAQLQPRVRAAGRSRL